MTERNASELESVEAQPSVQPAPVTGREPADGSADPPIEIQSTTDPASAFEPDTGPAPTPLGDGTADGLDAELLENGLAVATGGDGTPGAVGMLDGGQTLTDSFSATLGQGGPVLLLLLFLSVAALAILLVKLWQFSRLQLGSNEPAEAGLRLWYQRAPEQALAAVENSPQPTARLLEQAFTGLSVAGVDLALLREELTRFATAQLEQLRSWLRALEVIAALSPLLGLLGTVLGMIEAFRQLELAGSQVDPAILSGGIWQALLTTAAGLGIAIPVVLLHSWLERRVERCGHQMEDALTRVFTRDLARRPGAVANGRSDATAAVATLAVTKPAPADISHAV